MSTVMRAKSIGRIARLADINSARHSAFNSTHNEHSLFYEQEALRAVCESEAVPYEQEAKASRKLAQTDRELRRIWSVNA